MARNSQNSRTANRKSTNSGSFGGVMDMARESPIAAAATAAGAVVAGVFLWTKRAQISDQISQLSDQIGEWKNSDHSPGIGTAGADTRVSGSTASGKPGEFAGTGSTARKPRRKTGSGRRAATSHASPANSASPASTGNSGITPA